MQISDNLLKKYDLPVPRYTSYPPANYFNNDFGKEQYSEMLTLSNLQKPESISLYIHIPFCNKICFYCGCNACNIGDGHMVKPYIEALKKEISMVAMHLDKRRKVTQIHYGGGTPNAIPAEVIQELNQFLFETFTFSEDAEIAIEAHPAYLDETYIKKLGQAGFNRYSLGIQDFDIEVLKTVNRAPATIPIHELMKMIRTNAPKSAINLDFIYGLPLQTPESFEYTIKKAIELNPDRLVTFSYAHVPWVKKQQKILEKSGLPSPEQKIKMFLAAHSSLLKKNYTAIGLDHYVKPTDELAIAVNSNQLHRNFQGYATRRTTGQVYAFGASAISQTESGYAQNTKDTQHYIDTISKGVFATEKGLKVSPEQIKVREIITHVMCNKQLNWAHMAERLNNTPEELKALTKPNATQFDVFTTDNLIESNPDGFTVTETGALFIRNIAAALDPAYKEQQNNYSQSI